MPLRRSLYSDSRRWTQDSLLRYFKLPLPASGSETSNSLHCFLCGTFARRYVVNGNRILRYRGRVRSAGIAFALSRLSLHGARKTATRKPKRSRSREDPPQKGRDATELRLGCGCERRRSSRELQVWLGRVRGSLQVTARTFPRMSCTPSVSCRSAELLARIHLRGEPWSEIEPSRSILDGREC